MTAHRKLRSQIARRAKEVAANLPRGMSISRRAYLGMLAKCPNERERRFWILVKRELDQRCFSEEFIVTLANALDPEHGEATVREIARTL